MICDLDGRNLAVSDGSGQLDQRELVNLGHVTK
jgi:hypothetical protein